MEKLTSYVGSGNPVPYNTKMMLSMFMGQDLDNSLKQQNVASNQTSLMGIQMQNAAKDQQLTNKAKSTQKGLSKVTLASRIKTDAQDSAQRERA